MYQMGRYVPKPRIIISQLLTKKFTEMKNIFVIFI